MHILFVLLLGVFINVGSTHPQNGTEIRAELQKELHSPWKADYTHLNQ